MNTIVLSGAESSGKSTLGRWFSERPEILYVPEYARMYMEKHGTTYDEQLLNKLWTEHLVFQQENIQQKENEHLALLDTDLITYQIWFEVVFGNVPNKLLECINLEQHHGYLLCYPDIEWSPDPLRENPNNRLKLFERHVELIKKHQRPFQIIKGDGNLRKQNAETALKKIQKRL